MSNSFHRISLADVLEKVQHLEKNQDNNRNDIDENKKDIDESKKDITKNTNKIE